MRRIAALVVVVLVAGGVTTSIALGRSNAHTATAATVGARSTKLGKVLVNAKGVTLYLFEKDKHGKSACTGACARAWPPLVVKGRPTASGGVHANLLGTTHRSDGTTQVTYAGHPLYTYIGDNKRPGKTTGEGSKAFGAEWYVLGVNGRKIEHEGS